MSVDALARAANLRDLGGHPSADGLSVRAGMLYRSGELTRLSGREQRELASLGLRTIVDLRTDEEVTRRGAAPRLKAARVVRLPIDSGDLTSTIVPAVLRGDFRDVPPDLLARVNRQLVRDATAQFREAIELVSDERARPLLFHCTHGKDRTGLLAGVVLLALDVPWDAVVADYLRSNVLRTAQHRWQWRAVRMLAPFLSRRPWRRPDLESVERLFRVVPENLEAALDEMRVLGGDVDAFFEVAYGLDASRRAALREALLERPTT